MTEDELAALQQQSVAELAAAVSGNLKAVLSPEAAAVLVAVPALCDEVRRLQEALRRLRGHVMREGHPVPLDVAALVEGALPH